MRQPCCEKDRINKGAWSKQEDQKLIDYIKAHGEGCWRSLPKAAGLHRCGKSCRLRWINYLRPDIKRGNFAQDEEDLIIKLHALLGNRWSLIAGRLPGRTDNEVKNYWNSHIRKKLIRMGIDPNNHKPHQHLIPISTINQKPPLLRSAPPPSHADSQITHSVDSMDEQQSKPTHNVKSKSADSHFRHDEGKMVGRQMSDHHTEPAVQVTSCVEHDETDTSPPPPLGSADLNLDLSIAVPVLQKRPVHWEEKQTGIDNMANNNTSLCSSFDSSSKVVVVVVNDGEVEPASTQASPTLLLFR